MLFHTKEGRLAMDGTEMDYIRFGHGPAPMVLIPGLGDGLATVRGRALLFALLYRKYGGDYTVYVFSRKNRLEADASTRSMARELAQAMRELGIRNADVVGISQGGMIAQYLAIDAPELVHRLVLAVTAPRPGRTLRQTVEGWMRLAEQGDYRGLRDDTAARSYSGRHLRRYRLLAPVLNRWGRPASLGRFLIQARACLRHDACAELEKIACPTLVIGGGRDRVVGRSASLRLAQRIRGSRLFVYEKLGHAACEEAGDFCARVLDFLREE